MHELLAVCYMTVDRDSLVNDMPPRSPRPSSVVNMDEALATTLDRAYVEHDAFALFQELMRSAKPFYEWRTEEGPVSCSRHVTTDGKLARRLSAPQAPIIQRCHHLYATLIRRIDPQLWERFDSEGVEAQIWAM